MSFFVLILFCLLVLFVKRGAAFALLISSLLVWPDYVRFEVIIAQMSIPRILAIIIILKWWKSARLKINGYDKLIIIYWLVNVTMQLIAGTDTKEFIRVVGRVMDTVIMYYAARVCLINLDEFKRFLAWIKYPALIATCLALYESSHASSIYTSLRAAVSWTWSFDLYEARLGTWVRAFGTTISPIYWGMTMALVFMMQFSANRLFNKRYFNVPLAVTCVGVFTSLSSGPLGAVIMLVGLSFLLNSKKRFVLFLKFFLIAALIVEIFSNRHFYDVVQYFALNSATAWYRSKLLTVAINNIGEYALFGVGAHWPNHWGAQIDGRGIVDVVNQYIMVALYGGLPLLILFLSLLYKPVVNFYKSWDINSAMTPITDARRVLCFALLSVGFTGFTVGFFNPFELLIYMLLGMARQLEHLQYSQIEQTKDDNYV